MYQMNSQPQRTISNEIAVRSSTGTWFNSFLNIAILLLTVEILHLNRKNVENSSRNAENSSIMISELQKINERLEKL